MSAIVVDYGLLGATGNVGSHCLQYLKRFHSDASYVCFSRTSSNNKDGISYSCYVDMSDSQSIKDALKSYHPKVLFVAMPQSLSSEGMMRCATAICEAVSELDQVVTIVRLSSYAIEPNANNTKGQGSLGNAHLYAEKCLIEKGIRLVSIRPTSFFTNFENYDLPALIGTAPSYNVMSPLGHGSTSKVNWVSVEDVGNVAASCMIKCLNGEMLHANTNTADSNYHIVNVTGNAENTLTLKDYCALLSDVCGVPVTYTDLQLPEASDFSELWQFLRNGGFDACTTSVKDYTGREPISLLAYVRTATGKSAIEEKEDFEEGITVKNESSKRKSTELDATIAIEEDHKNKQASEEADPNTTKPPAFTISEKLQKMQKRDVDIFGKSNWTNRFHAKGCPCCD
jgi:hypothetical protein